MWYIHLRPTMLAIFSGVTETAAQEKADGKFFRFLRNRPGSLEGFCIFEVVHER